MKLLLIAVVICIYASGFLTSAEVKCEPLYNGGRGGRGGGYVIPKWSFDPRSNHCEQVMVKSVCRGSSNCFNTKEDCEEDCVTVHDGAGLEEAFDSFHKVS
uniref:Putative secreted protein n=1 Tax=Ixodes ricinus TaxID=34613 RepID=V5GMW4_IXORI